MTKGRVITGILFLALIAFVWAFVLPPSLGGRTTYYVTQGISMEPYLTQGDSTIIQKKSTYNVGDVVAFDDKVINAVSMHRIIAVDPSGTYTTKGDNNNWVDIFHPGDSDIIGKLVYKASGVSEVIKTATSVPVRVVGIGLISWALYGLIFGRRESRRERLTNAKQHLAQTASGVKAKAPTLRARNAAPSFGALFLVSIMLFGVSFLKPPGSGDVFQIYNLAGDFTYAGLGAPGSEDIYDDRQVATSQPVFTALVDDMVLSYKFRLDSPAPYKGDATYSDVVTISGASGWQHTFDRSPERPFVGKTYQTNTSLDLVALKAKALEIQDRIGVKEDGFKINIEPTVKLDGTLGGTPLRSNFATRLGLMVDKASVRPEPAPTTSAGPTANPGEVVPVLSGLNPRMGGKLTTPKDRPTAIAAFGAMIAIETVRYTGLAGVLISGFGLAALYVARRRRDATEDIHDVAVRQYRQLFVAVAGVSTVNGRTIEVTSLDALARIAETYEALIFEQETPIGIVYFCEHGSSRYRYLHKAVSANERFGVKSAESEEAKSL